MAVDDFYRLAAPPTQPATTVVDHPSYPHPFVRPPAAPPFPASSRTSAAVVRGRRRTVRAHLAAASVRFYESMTSRLAVTHVTPSIRAHSSSCRSLRCELGRYAARVRATTNIYRATRSADEHENKPDRRKNPEAEHTQNKTSTEDTGPARSPAPLHTTTISSPWLT